MIACRFNHVRVAKLLLDAGVERNAKDSYGQTALIGAVLGRHIEVIKLLIASGASVDEPDYRGGTALTYARLWGPPAVVKTLDAASRDRGWKDGNGQSVPFLILFGVCGGLLLSVLEHLEGGGNQPRPSPSWFRHFFAWIIVPALGALLVVAFVLTGASLTPLLAIGVGLSGPALIRAWRKKPLTTSIGEVALPAPAAAPTRNG